MKLNLNYSGKPRRRRSKGYKTTILILGVMFVVGVGPLIADQISNVVSQNSTYETQTVESSISPAPVESSASSSPNAESSSTPTPIESSETNLQVESDSPNSAESQDDSITATATATPTKIPPHAVMNQDMVIKIPRVQRVDPRASRFNLPEVNFFATGSPYLMLCMNSSRANIDIQVKGIDDSFEGKNLYITGDQSTAVQISGVSSQVLNIFNSFGGLRLIGVDGKGVSGTNLFIRFVAISEPTQNFSLCGESASGSQWLIEIQPLGLQINTKKNPVTLGDKTKKP